MEGINNGPDADRPEGMFRGLIESAPDAMVVVDAAGCIRLVNAQAERLFGYPRAELLGKSIDVLVPSRFHDAHSRHHARYNADPRQRVIGTGQDLFGRRKDGTEFPVEISLSPVQTTEGTLTSSAIRDISERKQIEAAASHLAAVVAASTDAIISKTLDGIVLTWNGGAQRLYGYTADEMCGRSISQLIPAGDDDDLTDILARVRSGERIENLETLRARKDGTRIEVSLTVSPIRDPAGKVIAASAIARDVSAVVRYREQLRALAEHDALTGTCNRRRFEQDLGIQLDRARRYRETAAVLVIDVDRFKQINDRYGHKAGDRALKAIAAALRGRLRETDMVARLGGDEFGVLLPYATAEQATAVARDIRAVIADAFVDVGSPDRVRISISVGVAIIDADTVSEDAVLAEADLRMYEDKLGSRPAAG